MPDKYKITREEGEESPRTCSNESMTVRTGIYSREYVSGSMIYHGILTERAAAPPSGGKGFRFNCGHDWGIIYEKQCFLFQHLSYQSRFKIYTYRLFHERNKI